MGMVWKRKDERGWGNKFSESGEFQNSFTEAPVIEAGNWGKKLDLMWLSGRLVMFIFFPTPGCFFFFL